MISDRQTSVSFRVPCEFVDASGDESECDLDLGPAKLHLKGGRLARMLRRMEEAKRKGCGTFEIVLAFPVHQTPILKFVGMRKGRSKRVLYGDSDE